MYIFPVHLFNPKSIKAKPRARVIDGGTALNGDQDVISADGGGRWYISYSGIAIRGPKMERLWAQWDSYLLGGARAVLVPLVSIRTAPRPIGASNPLRTSELYTDDEVFPTVTRYAVPYIQAATVGSAAARSIDLTINVIKGSRIQGGESFSIGGRAYIVERVTSRTGQSATCIISPPLRAAVADGTPVNFEWPVVQAKLAMGQDLGVDISFGGFGDTSITFVEDFSGAN